MVRFFGCLAHALYYIHSKLTKHLDIKPQNILVKRRYHQKAPNSGAPHAHYHVYIADFGLSKSFSTEAQSQTDSASPKTPKYCAPEVYYQEAKGRSADIFSMGCVYLEMMTVIHGGSLDDIDDIIKSPNGSLSYRENIDNAIRWLSQLNMTLVPWDTWALGANSGFGCARKSMMLATISHMLDPDKEERVTSDEVSQFIGEHDCCNQDQEPFAIEDEQIRDNPSTASEYHLKHDVSWFDTCEIRHFIEIIIIGCLRSDFSDLELVRRVMRYAVCVRRFLGGFPHTENLLQSLQHPFQTLGEKILRIFTLVGGDITLCMGLQQFLPPSYLIIHPQSAGGHSKHEILAVSLCGAILKSVGMPYLDVSPSSDS
jgi:serine/threonine protein kinase